MSHEQLLAGLVFILNFPFGYWRAGVKKFTLPWFVAVHASIPLIALLRFLMGVGWHWQSLPLFVGAYAVGQFLGGRCQGWRSRSGA